MPRIEISQKAESVLRVEAAVQGIKPTRLLEQLVFEGVKSDQARSMISPIPSLRIYEAPGQFPVEPEQLKMFIPEKKTCATCGGPLGVVAQCRNGINYCSTECATARDRTEQPTGKSDVLVEPAKHQTCELDKSVKSAWDRGFRSERKIAEAINSSKSSVHRALERLRAAGEITE